MILFIMCHFFLEAIVFFWFKAISKIVVRAVKVDDINLSWSIVLSPNINILHGHIHNIFR